MIIINIVAVISNLYVVTVNKLPNNVPFLTIIQFISRIPKCLGSYPCGYADSRLGFTALEDDGAYSFSFVSPGIFVWCKVVCIVSQYKASASE